MKEFIKLWLLPITIVIGMTGPFFVVVYLQPDHVKCGEV